MSNNASKKIALIVERKNDQDMIALLETLVVQELPEGMTTELVEVYRKKGQSRAAAYNEALKKTDAKYKIYLDEKTRILDNKLLSKLLAGFQKDNNLAVLGVAGTTVLPTDGICAMAAKRAGHIFLGDGEDRQEADWAGKGKKEGIIPVEAVDDWLFATQYDLPWRDDILQKECFLATAQSLEYRRKGYSCGVVYSSNVTAQYTVTQFSYDKKSQDAFWDEYSYEFFPLVSVIIPTYQRPDWFKKALDSVLAQTYRNIEIFITDNSHDTRTKELMQPYLAKYSNIIYEHHPEYKGAGDNWARARAYNNPKAEYVNWLMDDDLFKPNKIQVMMDRFRQEDNVALVTSFRECINAEGEVIPSVPGFQKVFNRNTCVDGEMAGHTVLMRIANFIGEPTTALAKKEFMNQGYNLGWEGRDDYFFISDYPTWLNCLEHGNLIYLVEPLSQIRIHEGQDQWNPATGLSLAACYGSCVMYAWRNKKYIKTKQDYLQCLRNFWGTYNGRVKAAQQNGYDLKKFWGYERLQKLLAEIEKETEQFKS